MKSYLFACALLTTMFVGPGAFAQTAPATDTKGPFKTITQEYRMKPAIDADVLVGQATEIWARAFWPADMVDPSTGKALKKHPLLVFLHGNHGTCGTGTAPRNDSSCEYTNEGSCPAGYVVTPNHEGYNYVAENLASWGYIVVSVNANRGITCGSGNSDDWGLILARGRLVLRHLQLWSAWATSGGAPSTLGGPDQFVGAVDFSNVGLMGHSRGGEGVRAALNLYRDPSNPWVARIPGLDIKAIYEIGAVDGQSNRVLDAPSVAWNQTLPLCDGDVSDLQGRMPFERMMARFSAKQEGETRPSAKSLTMVWGANHNYFNTEWQTSDSYGCMGAPTQKPIFEETKSGSLQQQSIANQSMTAFFLSHVGEDRMPDLAQNFDPAYTLPNAVTSITNVDRDFVPGYELVKVLRVDDFTSPTGENPAGPKNVISNVQVTHDTSAEPPVANVSWSQPGDDRFYQTNFADKDAGSDVSSFDFLDFRVGRGLNDPEKELAIPVDFGVELVASDDTVSPIVAIGEYSKLLGPPNDNIELTQTVRIPLAKFGALAKVRGVRFVFNGSKDSKVRLAHVRFGVAGEKITSYGSKTFSEIFDIQAAAALLAGTPLSLMDANPAETTPPDMILPADGSHLLATPFELASPLSKTPFSERRGSWMRPRKIQKSSQLLGDQGLGAIEFTVASADMFPVMDALPVLNIENHLFPIARFPSNGKTHTMIFTMSKASYDLLPNVGRAQVQYGLKIPSRIWALPNFTKSEIAPALNE
ncbi:hypothetical protein BH10BDE1_BH10BDE1_19850 [soil metagenome]